MLPTKRVVMSLLTVETLLVPQVDFTSTAVPLKLQSHLVLWLLPMIPLSLSHHLLNLKITVSLVVLGANMLVLSTCIQVSEVTLLLLHGVFGAKAIQELIASFLPNTTMVVAALGPPLVPHSLPNWMPAKLPSTVSTVSLVAKHLGSTLQFRIFFRTHNLLYTTGNK